MFGGGVHISSCRHVLHRLLRWFAFRDFAVTIMQLCCHLTVNIRRTERPWQVVEINYFHCGFLELKLILLYAKQIVLSCFFFNVCKPLSRRIVAPAPLDGEVAADDPCEERPSSFTDMDFYFRLFRGTYLQSLYISPSFVYWLFDSSFVRENKKGKLQTIT